MLITVRFYHLDLRILNQALHVCSDEVHPKALLGAGKAGLSP